jgi:hypothetical protein
MEGNHSGEEGEACQDRRDGFHCSALSVCVCRLSLHL